MGLGREALKIYVFGLFLRSPFAIFVTAVGRMSHREAAVRLEHADREPNYYKKIILWLI